MAPVELAMLVKEVSDEALVRATVPVVFGKVIVLEDDPAVAVNVVVYGFVPASTIWFEVFEAESMLAPSLPVDESKVSVDTVFGSRLPVASTANSGKQVVSDASLATVTVAAFPVILPAIALVQVMSVAHNFVNLAPVAPMVCGVD